MKFTIAAATLMIGINMPIATSAARQASDQKSVLFEQLAACRTIANDTERLGCFDQRASTFETAQRTGDVVVVDRSQIRQARRQLFGFELGSMPDIFAGHQAEAPIDAIETSLTSAVQGGDGKWVFKLADGSEWRQIDSDPVRFRNQEGIQIRIRRAALGSYQLVAGNSRAVRVRRQ